jgi:hypothetical protein
MSTKSRTHVPMSQLRDSVNKDKPIKIYNPYGDNIAKGASPDEKDRKEVNELIKKDNGKLSLFDKIKAKLKIDKDVQGAIYRLTLMVYAPDNKNGVSIINVGMPNKKEYKKVKRAMRKKDFAKFQHLHGDLGRINLGYPIVYIAAEEIKPQKGSGIIIPTEFNQTSGINYKVDP